MRIYEVYFDDCIIDEFFLDDAIRKLYEEDALVAIDRVEKIVYTFEDTYEKFKDKWSFLDGHVVFLPKDIPDDSED